MPTTESLFEFLAKLIVAAFCKEIPIFTTNGMLMSLDQRLCGSKCLLVLYRLTTPPLVRTTKISIHEKYE